LRMDHHCPFVSNCIGFSNHKFFLLMAAYSCLACVIDAATTAPELIDCALGATDSWCSENTLDGWLFQYGAMLTFFTLLFLAALIHSHFPAALENVTSIEKHYANMPNPYDLQSWKANLTQIMGKVGWDWLLPVSPRNPVTDGFSFPTLSECLHQQQCQVSPLERSMEEQWCRRYADPEADSWDLSTILAPWRSPGMPDTHHESRLARAAERPTATLLQITWEAECGTSHDVGLSKASMPV